MATLSSIPHIDPSVRFVSLGQLRKEKDFTSTLVVNVEQKPVAVVVPYETFIAMQRSIAEADRGAIA